MTESANRSTESGTSTGKKIFRVVQIVFAVTLIIVILNYVQVDDWAEIPAGTPGEGHYTGEVIGCDDGTILFESPGEIRVKASYGGSAIETATLTLRDGREIELKGDEAALLKIQKGLFTVLRETDPFVYAQALVIYLLAYCCGVLRWRILLQAAGLPITLFRAVRLNCIGLFFNNVVPGLTGGDLVKAYCITRDNPEKKTDAVITVVIDRVMGLFALVVVAAAAVLTDFETYKEIAVSIFLFLGGISAAAVIFYSRRLRKLLFVNRIIRFLPFRELIVKVDRSVTLYRYRKGSVAVGMLLSCGVHVFVIVTVWILGRGLSIDCDLMTCAILIPLILTVSALPLTPAGWGVGEAAFVFFYGLVGVQAAPALALSLLHRFNTLLISLSGGLFLLFGREAPARDDGGEPPRTGEDEEEEAP